MQPLWINTQSLSWCETQTWLVIRFPAARAFLFLASQRHLIFFFFLNGKYSLLCGRRRKLSNKCQKYFTTPDLCSSLYLTFLKTLELKKKKILPLPVPQILKSRALFNSTCKEVYCKFMNKIELMWKRRLFWKYNNTSMEWKKKIWGDKTEWKI